MTTNLERIIRPFETGDVAPPQQLPVAPEQAPANIVVKIGEDATAKTFSGSSSGSMTVYQDAHAKETERKEHTKRIENPDDPSQFVKVKVIEKITTQEGSGPTFQRRFLDYKPPNDGIRDAGTSPDGSENVG